MRSANMFWVRFISVERLAAYFVQRIAYFGSNTEYGHLRSAHQLI